MRVFWIFLIVMTAGFGFSQANLAIQRAHSDDIVQLEFSSSGRFLASCARNNEFVIWDLFHEKAISSFSLSAVETIKGFKFDPAEEELNVLTNRTTFRYSLSNESLKQAVSSDSLFRNKQLFVHPELSERLYIRKGLIFKRIKNRRLPRYKLSVPNIKADFTAIDVNREENILLAVAQDEKLYVFDYNFGIKWRELSGHVSQLYDVRFAPDGKTFVTAGKDRSIVVWDTKTMKIISRLTSNVYRKKTVAFSHDGNQLFVGDELGYVYGIDFRTAFPQITVTRPTLQAVNKILPNPLTKTDYFMATDNNYVYQMSDPLAQNSIEKYAMRSLAFLKAKSVLLQDHLKVYQEPYGQIEKMSLSPNGKLLAYTGQSDYPCISIANLQKGDVRRFYKPYSNDTWIDTDFLNDSTFIGINDSSNVLYFWMIDGKESYLKTDTLNFILQDFEVIDSATIWLNTKHYGQFIYNPYSRRSKKMVDYGALEIFRRGKFLVMENFSGAIDFYDLEHEKIYARFIGHQDKVTDIQFHPNGDTFVTSSNDGTIRFWSLASKQSLAIFIPFKNEEFILITGDNYYLMSKGAMDEIGFKVKGKYYYPEQFDLKYNRPDIVLDKLKFSDKDLILAYHQAYLKRLKKI